RTKYSRSWSGSVARTAIKGGPAHVRRRGRRAARYGPWRQSIKVTRNASLARSGEQDPPEDTSRRGKRVLVAPGGGKGDRRGGSHPTSIPQWGWDSQFALATVPHGFQSASDLQPLRSGQGELLPFGRASAQCRVRFTLIIGVVLSQSVSQALSSTDWRPPRSGRLRHVTETANRLRSVTE